jgi:hypothetical protein
MDHFQNSHNTHLRVPWFLYRIKRWKYRWSWIRMRLKILLKLSTIKKLKRTIDYLFFCEFLRRIMVFYLILDKLHYINFFQILMLDIYNQCLKAILFSKIKITIHALVSIRLSHLLNPF